MTTIPLTTEIIRAHIGRQSFSGCDDIAKILCRTTATPENTASIEARIPASSTRQGSYSISIQVQSDGSRILSSTCTCPVGYKCKHIYKVLCRIASSRRDPLPGPSPQDLVREARRQQYAEQLEHASVYIAIACKSELDSGSDFRRSYYIKDNVDQEILGVFFSKRLANQCARDYLGMDDEDEMDDDDDDDEDIESDDEASFTYDGSDEGDHDEENMYQKVWVERRAIEDATPRFRK